MMICPSGHQSEAEDYCDTCGAPIDPSTQPTPPPPSASGAPGSGVPGSGAAPAAAPAQPQPCPNCQVRNSPDALFCEACGYDFTTGSMPRAAAFDPFSLPSDAPDASGRSPEPAPGHDSQARAAADAPSEPPAGDPAAADQARREQVVEAPVAAERASVPPTGEPEDPTSAAAPSADPPGERAAASWTVVESGTAPTTEPSTGSDPGSGDAEPSTEDESTEDESTEDESGQRGDPSAAADRDLSADRPGADRQEAYGSQDEYADAPLSAAGSAAAPPSAALTQPSAPPVETDVVWVAEVWIDPDWYRQQQPPDAMPSLGLPTIVPLRGKSVLIGRESRSRNIIPDIDCGSDPGASRRQAQLTTDGQRWWVEDLDSANGTYVSDPSEGLPDDPVKVGQRHELLPDDRIHLGAWTRLVIRKATEEEIEAYA